MPDTTNLPPASPGSHAAVLRSAYVRIVGKEPVPGTAEALLYAAYSETAGDPGAALAGLAREKPYVGDAVRRHVAGGNALFAQPSILLAYLEAVHRPRSARQRWPLTPAEMRPLLTDLGQADD